MEETIQTHRAITDAVLAGDSVGARCAMVMHLTYNRQALRRMLHDHQAGALEPSAPPELSDNPDAPPPGETSAAPEN